MCLSVADRVVRDVPPSESRSAVNDDDPALTCTLVFGLSEPAWPVQYGFPAGSVSVDRQVKSEVFSTHIFFDSRTVSSLPDFDSYLQGETRIADVTVGLSRQ